VIASTSTCQSLPECADSFQSIKTPGWYFVCLKINSTRKLPLVFHTSFLNWDQTVNDGRKSVLSHVPCLTRRKTMLSQKPSFLRLNWGSMVLPSDHLQIGNSFYFRFNLVSQNKIRKRSTFSISLHQSLYDCEIIQSLLPFWNPQQTATYFFFFVSFHQSFISVRFAVFLYRKLMSISWQILNQARKYAIIEIYNNNRKQIFLDMFAFMSSVDEILSLDHPLRKTWYSR
jgi:hypothetical protein